MCLEVIKLSWNGMGTETAALIRGGAAHAGSIKLDLGGENKWRDSGS